MGLTRSGKDEALAKLYAQIPDIPDCDGRCWTTCGPIGMSDRERQRIRQETGVRITPFEVAKNDPGTFRCDALTADRRCAVYEARPLICRLWGAVEGLPCVYGCVPEGGRYLTDEEGVRLIAESLRIGGGPVNATRERVEQVLSGELMRREMSARYEVGNALDQFHALPAAYRSLGGAQRVLDQAARRRRA